MADPDFVPSDSDESASPLSPGQLFLIDQLRGMADPSLQASQRENAWLANVYVSDSLPLVSGDVRSRSGSGDDGEEEEDDTPVFLTTAQQQVLDIINMRGRAALQAIPHSRYGGALNAGFWGRVELIPQFPSYWKIAQPRIKSLATHLKELQEFQQSPFMQMINDSIPAQLAVRRQKVHTETVAALVSEIQVLLNGGHTEMAKRMLVPSPTNTARAHVFSDCPICFRTRTVVDVVCLNEDGSSTDERVVSVVDLGCGGTESRHTMCMYCFCEMFRVFSEYEGDIPAKFRCPHCRADILTQPVHRMYRFAEDLWTVDEDGDLSKHPEFEARLVKSKFNPPKRRKRGREGKGGRATGRGEPKRAKPLVASGTQNT